MANYVVDSPKGDEILKEDESYRWISHSKNSEKCNYNNKPFEFVELLLENAKAYVNFFHGNDNWGANVHLNNIRKVGGGSFRQYLVLLLSARHLSKENFDHLAKQIETLIFYYFLTREATKEFERNFSKWANELRKIKDRVGLNVFIIKNIKPEIDKKESDFKDRFLNLNQNSLQQYRMRYVLAKLTQYCDQERFGSYTPQNLDGYIKKGVEIEHILPNKPDNDLKQSFGEEEYDSYKIRLGNLTLLEKSINASISNGEFYSKKIQEYGKSQLYLTKSIRQLENVGENTSINRLNERLQSFNEWNRDSIEKRQEMRYSLAKSIWSVNELV